MNLPPGTARSNASAVSHLSARSNMSQGRLEKLMRLQHRENSKPRSKLPTHRSKSQNSMHPPRTGQSQGQPSRPATGMSGHYMDQNTQQARGYHPQPIDEDQEIGEWDEGLQLTGEPEDYGAPPQTGGSVRSGQSEAAN